MWAGLTGAVNGNPLLIMTRGQPETAEATEYIKSLVCLRLRCIRVQNVARDGCGSLLRANFPWHTQATSPGTLSLNLVRGKNSYHSSCLYYQRHIYTNSETPKMAAIAQISNIGGGLVSSFGIDSVGAGQSLPCHPGTPPAVSWDTLGLGPAPPTTCVLVQQDAVTPPSPSTPKDLIKSTVGASPLPASTCSARRLPVQSSAELMRCKRRIDFAIRSAVPAARHLHKPQTPSVVRRNERERNRVRLVNMGFTTLRQHIPAGRDNRKMSKVETLRAAVEYIKHLQDVLGDNETQIDLSFETIPQGESHETTFQYLAAACDLQQHTQQQLSPSGSAGESAHSPSPSGYSSSAEDSHTTADPRSPDEANLVDLTAWLQ